MIIASHLLRAAQMCVAKNHIKYCLNGIHITPKYLEATNGHVALRLEHGIKTKNNIIVQFNEKIPAKAETTEFVLAKDPYTIHRDKYEHRIGITTLSLLNAQFPNLSRIIPTENTQDIPYIDAKYLSLPDKMFSAENIAVQLAPAGMTSACCFKFNKEVNKKYGNPEFVVMPVRVKE
ncbi:bacteriophage protein [Xenorhabdus vietnamensis]|uniref:Bacteriophage protein n=1 Tax=Xenorhabdus vietnamensis TaxID=351656 RepID=A0A1Y2S7I6_9GAMM|nr:hypothetical protein [Xenorhabdus vietnamensis]OTA14634.1 bacteriophage protein [Xenorhabdus vietnamensis]